MIARLLLLALLSSLAYLAGSELASHYQTIADSLATVPTPPAALSR